MAKRKRKDEAEVVDLLRVKVRRLIREQHGCGPFHDRYDEISKELLRLGPNALQYVSEFDPPRH